MKTNYFKHQIPITLESGKKLPEVTIAYHTFGKPNKNFDNVIWVTHALTANSNPTEWWKGLVGENNLFNPEKHFIVCANILGSHYGSTSPLSLNPLTGNPYYHYFPEFTIRDIVSTLELLRKHLGIKKIQTLIGGSMGGQQALEWAYQQPDLFENLILLATNAKHSPWGIAFNESQRLAIQADRTFYSNSNESGKKGLKAARAIALLSYRNYNTYQATQEDDEDELKFFKSSSYQNYQGEKLVNRFNAYSYWYLSKAMDSHNIGRNRGGIKNALSKIKAKTLVISIVSDVLFPPQEQEILAKHIPNSSLFKLDSLYGHDGFLIETKKISTAINTFFKYNTKKQNNYEYAI